MEPIRAIISGGGTGGHIFPAISIANALKAADPRTEILFVIIDSGDKQVCYLYPHAGITHCQ